MRAEAAFVVGLERTFHWQIPSSQAMSVAAFTEKPSRVCGLGSDIDGRLTH